MKNKTVFKKTYKILNSIFISNGSIKKDRILSYGEININKNEVSCHNFKILMKKRPKGESIIYLDCSDRFPKLVEWIVRETFKVNRKV